MANARPTEQQIQAEIKKLEELMPKVRQTSMFGDDNRAAIAAQIEVLKEKLDETEIYDKEDEDAWPGSAIDAAISARQWLDGEYEMPTLSEDWEPLILG